MRGLLLMVKGFADDDSAQDRASQRSNGFSFARLATYID